MMFVELSRWGGSFFCPRPSFHALRGMRQRTLRVHATRSVGGGIPRGAWNEVTLLAESIDIAP